MASVGHDRLGNLDLAKVEIQQSAVFIDRRNADDGEIDLELADKIHCGLTDDAAIGTAHDAASDHHLDARKNP
ncbi:hypothetical protein D3C87_1614300 [compost metagenome]